MKKKLLWITQTGLMLALLVCLQNITKPMGQLITGSCVNAVLAITVLMAGLSSGITVALISPVLAYVLGIAPQILTVLAIMVGNSVYVAVLCWIAGKKGNVVRAIIAWAVSAFAKFATLYAIVVWLICGVFAQKLLEAGTLKPPMLKVLPATFSWAQLFTALIGGAVALLIAPVIRKALKR